MGAYVRLEVDDGVGVVRLDRPPANAIDLQLATELNEAIARAADDDEVGALVLWGGERIFAAGADIKAMAEWGPDEVRPSVDALGAACDLLEAIPKVSIAAINGYALGGGFEIALGADLRFLADDASVGQPEIKLGVIPGAGGTQRLTRLVGPARTRDLVFSGRVVPAEEALALGLADRIVPAAERARDGGRGRPDAGPGAAGGARGRQGRDRRSDRVARARGHRPGTAAVPVAVRHGRPTRGHAGLPRQARSHVRSRLTSRTSVRRPEPMQSHAVHPSE